MSDHGAELEEVRALLAGGDARGAFARVRARLSWPAGRDVAADAVPAWLELLAALARVHGMDELAGIVDAAVRDPASPDQLYALGYALIDADVPAVAATVLGQCLALVGDSEEVVCELVSALERAMLYRDALDVLERRAALRTRSFMCRYLYAYNAAMSGRLELTRATLLALDPPDDDAAALRTTIAGIVERADRIAGVAPLDERDLRGWHFVLTGGLLAHQSPYGFDEPMHGRYAWLQDSMPRVRAGIERLAELVAAAAPPCIYAPPGRDHEIVALALARRLGVSVAPWPAVGVPAPGVIALYDLAALPSDCVAQVVQRREGQVLFAHASPWTTDSPVAPDVTTLLYQSLVSPWGERSAVDPTTRETVRRPADDRPAAELADELFACRWRDEVEQEADEPARWSALAEHAWPPSPGPRSRLWAGSPVPSNRF